MTTSSGKVDELYWDIENLAGGNVIPTKRKFIEKQGFLEDNKRKLEKFARNGEEVDYRCSARRDAGSGEVTRLAATADPYVKIITCLCVCSARWIIILSCRRQQFNTCCSPF
ncbi:hypothetical protein J6590_024960 [Homalodisca vitripennis]|nr:hypothetical protein J6590_024960 [Homalodisca vitripennis]